ncbi:hypothetical protein [Paenibacillus sp. VTT E-133291]|uniref:hypothetical protein n=1 Tax=Paenibacillus sp. VTT E-133291 TaxID=1986223 RepID=UPI000B9FE678|nr:hypothetical protein [Paenibacillus sp. VTT E-133291]OZQ97343.1 hypothetical protein CA598_06000 [Paenibacillus sp. VTT E-133291]
MFTLNVDKLSLSEQYELSRSIVLGLLRLKKKILVVGPIASGKTYLIDYLKSQAETEKFKFIDSISSNEEFLPLLHLDSVIATAQNVEHVCNSLNILLPDLLTRINIIIQTNHIGSIKINDSKSFKLESNVSWREFVQENIIYTEEAASILNCTKQNIHKLIGENKIIPLKQSRNMTLYLKEEISLLKI